jgi:tryptophan halogenase
MTRGHIIKYEFGTFMPASWLAVLLGQNLVPRGYDPRVRKIADDRLQMEARRIRDAVRSAVERTPEHADFIRRIGAGSGSAPLMAGMI